MGCFMCSCCLHAWSLLTNLLCQFVRQLLLFHLMNKLTQRQAGGTATAVSWDLRSSAQYRKHHQTETALIYCTNLLAKWQQH